MAADRRLVGRARELASLEERLARIGAGGGALLIRGEAGVGKSALLGAARRIADERGMATLTTIGIQSETHLAFAGLHQLLRPALSALDGLPAPQRAAVQAAFGLTNAEAPDFFLIALAALDLLSDMAALVPLLLVIEDAHWLDAATSDVLAFVSRRLEHEPIVALFAVRDGLAARIDQAGLPELRLEPLDDDASALVLDASAPDLAPDLRQRVLAVARGNPLALVELPRAIAPDRDRLPATPLPLTERLERAFAARVSGLPAATRTLLLVATLDDDGDLDQISAAASHLDGRPVGIAELSTAAASGAVTIELNRLRFRHPLVRSAIYHGALTPERRAAHAALADVYRGDPDRRVWHRAASLASQDDQIATELEAVAGRALRRGAPGVAAIALERAAQLATDDEWRGRLLIAAAWANEELGQTDDYLRLARDAQQLELGQATRTMLLYMLERFQPGTWSGASKIRSIVKIAEKLQAVGETDRALEALQVFSLRYWWGNLDQELRELIVAAAERLPVPDDNPTLLAVLAQADPVRRGSVVAARLAAYAGADVRHPAAASDSLVAEHLSVAAAAIWDQEAALRFATVAVDGMRTQGQLGGLARALVHQAWAGVHLGSLQLATTAAEEAARLAADFGWSQWATTASLALATMAAERGDAATSATLIAEAEQALLPTRANPMLALVQFARGRAAMADQRFDDGYQQIRRIFDPADVAHHPYVRVWAIADLVETAVHGDGNVEEAQLFLAELESLQVETWSSFLRAQLNYARPLLSPDDQAESLFKSALADDLQRWPYLRGRTLLAYGAWLRRHRRVTESRTPLRVAHETFEALGFAMWSERARQELRATGETAHRRTPDALAQLTPQELQIAQMAADGQTNREISQRLYISHRTVAYHLYRVFPKLGISTRSQLRNALTD